MCKAAAGMVLYIPTNSFLDCATSLFGPFDAIGKCPPFDIIMVKCDCLACVCAVTVIKMIFDGK